VHTYRNGVVRPCTRPEGTSRWLAAAASPGRGASQSGGAPAWPSGAATLRETIERTPEAVCSALARFDFRAAASAVFEIVEQANRYVEAAAPWHLARAARAGDAAAGEQLDRVLGALIAACQVLAAEIWPFLPDLAARVAVACGDFGGAVPKPQPVFPRIEISSRRQYPAVAAPGGRVDSDAAGPAQPAPENVSEVEPCLVTPSLVEQR
jgi:methionyl-tRNA synthetase